MPDQKITIKGGNVVINPSGSAGPAGKSTWDGETVAGLLVKADSEQRFTLAVAYPADKADVAKAKDGHRDFASADAVEQAAWAYMLKSRQVSLWHAAGTEGAGEVVESYIWRGPEWPIEPPGGGQVLVKSGDWLLGIQWTPEAWPLVKEGHIRGLSPEGTASRRRPTAGAVAALRS